MAEIGIREIRAYLAQKSPESLIEEIIDLLKIYPDLKEYYQVKLSPKGDLEAFDKYKKIILKEFFPTRGFGKLKLSNIRKAINDYKKVSGSIEKRVELMLYFIEQGARFIHEYGDIDERFYESMESAYQEAVKLISMHGSKADWKKRFYDLVIATKDTGYGFGDTIRDTFEEFFEDED